MKRIRVLVADDHALVRAGIRALLERIKNIEVVAEAGIGEEALMLLRTHRPDLALLDNELPGLSGLAVLGIARKELPELRVIVLSIHESQEYAVAAMRGGADGFLSKRAATEDLTTAVTAVMRGEAYFEPNIAQQAALETKSLTDRTGEELTPRQLDVLRMMAGGYRTKEIARTLNISAKTVETHRASLMERLGIHDVAGLVRYAIRTGLVKLEE